eukprot:scaffold9828_cov105-Isochrysis_galbana.AAC.9
MVPAWGERISTVTLSVSTSANTSSRATWSPTFFASERTVPSVMESPIAGTGTSTVSPEAASQRREDAKSGGLTVRGTRDRTSAAGAATRHAEAPARGASDDSSRRMMLGGAEPRPRPAGGCETRNPSRPRPAGKARVHTAIAATAKQDVLFLPPAHGKCSEFGPAPPRTLECCWPRNRRWRPT